jgi:hypothetical protein
MLQVLTTWSQCLQHHHGISWSHSVLLMLCRWHKPTWKSQKWNHRNRFKQFRSQWTYQHRRLRSTSLKDPGIWSEVILAVIQSKPIQVGFFRHEFNYCSALSPYPFSHTPDSVSHITKIYLLLQHYAKPVTAAYTAMPLKKVSLAETFTVRSNKWMPEIPAIAKIKTS